MGKLHQDCQLKTKCKSCKFVDSDQTYCFGFRLMHGVEGNTGIFGMTNVPKQYRYLGTKDIPKVSPNVSKERLLQYIADIYKLVNQGVGIFMYSEPTADNPLGTGNGKTTCASIILNEYIRESVYQALLNKGDYDDVVPFFVSFPEFQNIYNSMYRSGTETNKYVTKYNTYKKRMKQAKLIVLDDIALRGCTEAFIGELYEIIDYRTSNSLCTIITSNLSLSGLETLYGQRVTSRIYTLCKGIVFRDKDHRKLNWDL